MAPLHKILFSNTFPSLKSLYILRHTSVELRNCFRTYDVSSNGAFKDPKLEHIDTLQLQLHHGLSSVAWILGKQTQNCF